MGVDASYKLDSQAVEILGRNRLVDELTRAGLEVAFPIRDRGIDLIVYLDTGDRFMAVPIQMKASSGAGFGIDRKYDKFPNLIHAWLWGVQDTSLSATYALTNGEVTSIAEAMGWTRTRSYARGAYSTRKPTSTLRALLKSYEIVTPELWLDKVLRVSRPTLL